MHQIGMFAKYWTPGAVKTRLAVDIGDVAASRIYRGFVVALLQRLGELGDRNILAVTPADRLGEFAGMASGWTIGPQTDGDLGERMRDYFDRSLANGATAVVLLGSDSPNVPRAYINEALGQLDVHDLVLGPTPDGGYYLIGARRASPDLFAGVQWSSPQVFRQTAANAERAGLKLGVLPEWYDVDDAEDLRRLLSELADTNEPALTTLRDLIKRETKMIG